MSRASSAGTPSIRSIISAMVRAVASRSAPGRVRCRSKVERLFDGHHTAGQFVGELPATSRDLFTEDFPNKIRDPEGVTKDGLRPMDPTAPTS